MLQDRSPFVRESLAYCLGSVARTMLDGHCHRQQCHDWLVSLALTDSVPRVRLAAARNLKDTTGDHNLEQVAIALGSMELTTRLRALDLLRHVPELGRLNLDRLRDNLLNSHRKVRQKAVAACEFLYEPVLVPLVARRLFERDDRIRAVSVNVLQSLCSSGAEWINEPRRDWLRIFVESDSPARCLAVMLDSATDSERLAFREFVRTVEGGDGASRRAADPDYRQVVSQLSWLASLRF